MMYRKELDPSQNQAMGMLIGMAVKLMWKEKWNGLGWLAWTKKAALGCSNNRGHYPPVECQA